MTVDAGARAVTLPRTRVVPLTWPVLLAFPLAGLIAIASAAGLLSPATYARETAAWAVEARAQDWIDLILVAPLLLLGAVFAMRLPGIGRIVLGGAMLFTAYSFLIYAFAVHFNGLFLVYCAALGVSAFGFAGLAVDAVNRAAVPPGTGGVGVRAAAWFLIVVAVLFAALWLSKAVPPIMAGKAPEELLVLGLLTNPVHVIDLSLLLPGQLVVAVALLRGRPLGYALAPFLLAFGILMALNIATIALVSRLNGLPGDIGQIGAFAVFALANLAMLVAFLRDRRAA